MRGWSSRGLCNRVCSRSVRHRSTPAWQSNHDARRHAKHTVTRKTLSFYRDQAEARDFDLVDIAESALKTHAERARKQKVSVQMTTDGPAFAPVFASEILQILSNCIIN